MKNLILLPLVLMMASLANAATIHGFVTNASQYPKAMVCVPGLEYAAEFQDVLNGVDSDGSNLHSAVTLFGFFQDTSKSACHLVSPDGSFSIDLPDSDVYLFLVLMTNEGKHAYWHVWNVDAQIEQVVTIDAPNF